MRVTDQPRAASASANAVISAASFPLVESVDMSQCAMATGSLAGRGMIWMEGTAVIGKVQRGPHKDVDSSQPGERQPPVAPFSTVANRGPGDTERQLAMTSLDS